MTEADAIKQIEDILHSIKDKEELKRIAQWVASKYGGITSPQPIFVPMPTPPVSVPYVPYIEPAPTIKPWEPNIIPLPYTTWCSADGEQPKDSIRYGDSTLNGGINCGNVGGTYRSH
jgi:hypothetical protein